MIVLIINGCRNSALRPLAAAESRPLPWPLQASGFAVVTQRCLQGKLVSCWLAL